jgi:hypothetical protein
VRCLTADPRRRPSMREVLQHPWCAEGMRPTTMLQYNNLLVASSLARPPRQEVRGKEAPEPRATTVPAVGCTGYYPVRKSSAAGGVILLLHLAHFSDQVLWCVPDCS